MDIGKLTISQIYPYLKVIADQYGFRLYIVKEFNMVRKIFINQFFWSSYDI